MWTNDFYTGAVWTLLCICMGVMGYLLTALYLDWRNGGGDDDKDPDAPDPIDEIENWVNDPRRQETG